MHVARDRPTPILHSAKALTLAIPELGAKQICPNCQSKFYDLGKRPAHCPKCDTEFDPEEALRSRRTSRRGATPDYDRDDAAEKTKAADTEDVDTDVVDEDEEEVDDTPELDEAVEAEPLETDDIDEDPGVPTPAEPDLGVGIEEEVLDDDTDDVPFLEDEDDDDFPDDEIEGLPGEDHEP
jgi:uncharacterized protein (TIGR02300 family)